MKRLPKPSKTAWVLNQLARQRPDEVERLLQAGRGAREAQQRALEGDASQLRAATRAEQDEITALVEAAVTLMGGDVRVDSAAADRIRRTLRAAATDEETGSLLRRGCLVADVEASGFGLEGLTAVAGPAPAPTRARGPDAAQRQAVRKAKAEAERLRKEAEAQQHRARRLVEEAERAQRRADEARRVADEAVEEAREAQLRAEEAAARVEVPEEA